MPKHKVFISYHHKNDQWYKDELIRMGKEYAVFIDKSVGGGNIPEDLTDEQIRRTVRDEYLRDSTVTVVLVGTETKRRKHVDWEIYSSMHDGIKNKKSGILVINLPSTDNGCLRALERMPTGMIDKASRSRFTDRPWRVRPRDTDGTAHWLHIVVMLKFQAAADSFMVPRMEGYAARPYESMRVGRAPNSKSRSQPLLWLGTAASALADQSEVPMILVAGRLSCSTGHHAPAAGLRLPTRPH